LEAFKVEEISHAVREVLRLSAISFDAAKTQSRNYPHLPLATASTTKAADYMSLISCIMVWEIRTKESKKISGSNWYSSQEGAHDDKKKEKAL